MEIIRWFADHGFGSVSEGIETLTDELAIRVKSYPDEKLHVFNYCQIESPKNHPVVKECRGLILTDDFQIVCRPFKRFFNLGETEETKTISISNSIAYEKLDGSLVKVYNYNDEWFVATRGTAFAESTNYTNQIFQDMIVRAFGCQSLEELRLKFRETLNPEYTFLFEFVSPANRIVTPYKEEKMYYLGAVHSRTGVEQLITLTDKTILKDTFGYHVDFPKTYSFSDTAEMKEFVESLDNLQEGVVIYDTISKLRAKVKSSTYVRMHRLRGNSLPTPKHIKELVIANEFDEYLTVFPEDRSVFEPYIEAWEGFKKHLSETWQKTSHIEDKKSFALQVKDLPGSSVLFSAKYTGESPLNVLAGLKENARVRLLETWMDRM